MTNLKNILFIVVDCLRADYIYEPNKSQIPNITKLKNNGFSFLNTIATTTTTSPSFSSLLTGLYPFENGVRSHSGYALKKDVITFPEILQKHGYHTYAEVTGPFVKELGLTKGFEEFNYRDRKETIFSNWGKTLLKKFKTHYESPWFTFLHIWSLHEPRMVLNEFNKKEYGNSNYPRAIASIDKYLGELFKVIEVDDTIIILTGDHGEQTYRSFIEKNIKKIIYKIIKKIKKYQLFKISFAKMVRPFHTGHGFSIYDILVKVPLIFYNKELVPTNHSTTQIRQIDIFPTILDLIKIKTNNKVTGKSTLPIIEQKDYKHRDAYLEAVGRAIPNKEEWLAGIRIANKFKYIYSPFRKKYKDELYYLEKDPFERINLAQIYPNFAEKFKERINNLKFKKFVGERLKKEEQQKVLERLRALGYVD